MAQPPVQPLEATPPLDIEHGSAPAHLAEASNTNEPRMPARLFALKSGDTYLVADAYGDVLGTADGLFHNDTRALSHFRLTIGGKAPTLLGGAVAQDNVIFASHMANRPLPPLGGEPMVEGVIHVARTRLLWQDRLYERICVTNYDERAVVVPIELSFFADFRDMFEVRGMQRPRRGFHMPTIVTPDSVLLSYTGLDRVVRRTCIAFAPEPASLAAGRAEFKLPLASKKSTEIYIEVASDPAPTPSRTRYRAAAARARFDMRRRRRRGARLHSSGRLFNDWLDRSRSDLALLTTDLATGPYPYAGIPWFSTTFGRDAIVAALQTLWIDPALARGVLCFLAQHQAHETDAFHASSPGKIMHEARKGEMTALKEVPFGRYYGGVDTTPLFVMLAGAYADRTADLALVRELWPALLAAAQWLEGDGDSNRDGFLDYPNTALNGLTNQAWKDSGDSISHADGTLPKGPIAVLEVQGYLFAAFRALSRLAARLDEPDLAARWKHLATITRERVEQSFWMDDVQFYGLALDGDNKLCRVRASNVGHLLYCGLPEPHRATLAIRHLLSASFNTGWGLRTLADNEVRFNPMSYHNGSIWPHDTAIAAAGMARYGERAGPVRLLSEVFEAAVAFGMRLPELYCGFTRVAGVEPIAYPVACVPQAWAAGATFMTLQACLGISVDAWRDEVQVTDPHLPIGIDRLEITGIAGASRCFDIVFDRRDGLIETRIGVSAKLS